MKPGRYVTGRELADAGLAELVELAPRNAGALMIAPRGKQQRAKAARR